MSKVICPLAENCNLWKGCRHSIEHIYDEGFCVRGIEWITRSHGWWGNGENPMCPACIEVIDEETFSEEEFEID